MDCLGLEERDRMGGRVLDETDETMQFKGTHDGVQEKIDLLSLQLENGQVLSCVFSAGGLRTDVES